MYPTPKNKAPLVLGIISLVFSLIFALVGLITGIIGLVQAINGGKNSEHSYKTEIILNSIGIGVSAINWIAGIIMLLNGGF